MLLLGLNMKKTLLPRVDVAKAIEVSGKDMYTTIIEAAQRARVIKTSRDKADSKAEKLHFYPYKPISQALQDIIDEKTK